MRVVNLVWGVLLLVAGIGALGLTITEALKLDENGEWPTISGRIVEARAQMIGRRIEEPAIFVRLTYTVDGRTYSMEDWITGVGSMAEATSLASTYLNSSRKVWYDPALPGRASLQSAGLQQLLVPLGITAVCLMGGSITLITQTRRGRRSAPAAASRKSSARPSGTTSYDEAIKADRKNPEAYFKRAVFLHQQNYLDDALKDYDQAIKLDSKKADYYRFRAAVNRDAGRHKEALKDFDTAIKLNPTNSEYFFRRGQLHAIMENNELSVQDITQAIQLEPASALLYFERGLSYEGLEKPKEAASDYARALKLDPNMGLVYRQRAMLYEKYGRYEKALEDYETYLQTDTVDERNEAKMIRERIQKMLQRMD